MDDQAFPEPTVGAFIFNQAGELLLLRHFIFFDYACRTHSTEMRLNKEEALLPLDHYTRVSIAKLIAMRAGSAWAAF